MITKQSKLTLLRGAVNSQNSQKQSILYLFGEGICQNCQNTKSPVLASFGKFNYVAHTNPASN